MELIRLLLTITVVVLALASVTSLLVLSRSHLNNGLEEWNSRIRTAFPFIAFLGGVLLVNALTRSTFHEISWWLGIEITHTILEIEGHLVATVQSALLSDWATMFFSWIYVYGYVFLLVYPLIIYFLSSKLNAFKSISVAYAANYGLGLILYIVFIGLGPRNMIPHLVEQPIYTEFPHLQLLTSEINEYSNVFPSLHTSLSATVMLFAWHTRTEYPRWVPIAFFLGIAIMVSTVYLGIHWVIDVLAGLVLAWISYRIGLRAVEDAWFSRVRESQLWPSRYSSQ